MKGIPIQPSLAEFEQLAKRGNVITVFTQLAADFETPLSAYHKLRNSRHSFLFESAESTDKSGRWSILGSNPRRIFTVSGKELHIQDRNGSSVTEEISDDLLAALERHMADMRPVPHPELPPFCGGLVGYVSYDAVRQFEPKVNQTPPDSLGLPEAIFLLTETLILFDHRLRRVLVLANAFLDEHPDTEAAYREAQRQIEDTVETLNKPLNIPALNGLTEIDPPEASSNTEHHEFIAMVERAKEYINAGEVSQVVPSQRFQTDFSGSAVNLYRALRHVNPSPYMFVLELGDFSLVGSSPEVNVRSVGGRIDIRPIAGTRRRGESAEEDRALAEELLADPKERAEHIMLIDLAKADVAQVAQEGTVEVDDLMVIERYSHVMHIVSNVTGKLAPAYSAYDVFRATFPAGTVSGAPKTRAMQIIDELEKNKRCSYSGAVGWFSFEGDLDSCITLRTCLLKDGKVYVQAGAGIVADSNSESEYQETVNKAKGMMRAIALAKTLQE